MLDVIVEQPLGERFVMLALEKTDERVRDDKPVSPGFLFAALLWHEVLAAWKSMEAEGMKPIPALHQAMDQVVAAQVEKLAIPRRFTADMKEIWALQPRFLNRSGSRPYRLLEHPRLRAGLDFLLLRCDSGEVEAEIGPVVGALQGRRRGGARAACWCRTAQGASASAGAARAARPAKRRSRSIPCPEHPVVRERTSFR